MGGGRLPVNRRTDFIRKGRFVAWRSGNTNMAGYHKQQILMIVFG